MTVPVLVIEGVDGSGKSSVAGSLASRLSARYVKPFDGEAGARIRAFNESGKQEAAERLARHVVQETMIRNADASLLIFDRHWLSILAYISERFAPFWQPYPPTVLLCASPERLQQRLLARRTPPEELTRLAHYAHRLDVLAAQFHVPRLDTTHTSVDDAVRIIMTSGWV